MSESEEKLHDEFLAIKDDLEKWGAAVDSTIVELLISFKKEERIKINPKFRIKQHWSFISKCLYRGKSYKDPLLDVEDKIGTRIVLLKSSDVYEAAEILNGHSGWNIKTTKNLKELIEDRPKEFDYQSVHLVVWPKEQLGFKTALDKLTCEIQVRTLLQHAFAEVSHDSTYKGPYKNDKEVLRKLSKSIALMEVTDDYFIEIFRIISDEKRKYSNLYNELITLYSKIKPDFENKAKDIELVDLVFRLLTETDVPYSKLEEFVVKRTDELKQAISQSRIYIFQQPIIILVAYYIFNHQTFLKDNWPLSNSVLKSIFNDFGISYSEQ